MSDAPHDTRVAPAWPVRAVMYAHIAGVVAFGLAARLDHTLNPSQIQLALMGVLLLWGLATMFLCPPVMIAVLSVTKQSHRDKAIAIVLTFAIEVAQVIAQMPLIQ